MTPDPRPTTVAVLVVIFTVDDGDLQALLIRRSAEPRRSLCLHIAARGQLAV